MKRHTLILALFLLFPFPVGCGDVQRAPDINLCLDKDLDGYWSGTLTPDCDDNDAAVNPGAIEVCGNAIDDNCDGQVDEGCIELCDESGEYHRDLEACRGLRGRLRTLGLWASHEP